MCKPTVVDQLSQIWGRIWIHFDFNYHSNTWLGPGFVEISYRIQEPWYEAQCCPSLDIYRDRKWKRVCSLGAYRRTRMPENSERWIPVSGLKSGHFGVNSTDPHMLVVHVCFRITGSFWIFYPSIQHYYITSHTIFLSSFWYDSRCCHLQLNCHLTVSTLTSPRGRGRCQLTRLRREFSRAK